MKKVMIVIMSVMAIFSTGFLITNIKEYNDNNKKVEEKDKSQLSIEEQTQIEEKNIEEKKEQYEKLKEDKKEDLEVYKKWENQVKEMEKYLQ